jgi:hypothetical protein
MRVESLFPDGRYTKVKGEIVGAPWQVLRRYFHPSTPSHTDSVPTEPNHRATTRSQCRSNIDTVVSGSCRIKKKQLSLCDMR